MRGYHTSVLLKETIDVLIPNRFGQDGLAEAVWYLDCTLGDGGHSLEILKRGGKVVGIDVDPQALERARKRFQSAGFRLRGRSDSRSYSEQEFILLRGNFRDIKNLLQTESVDLKFKGCLFDLGVSSLQLSNPERGFSFSKLGPLDMRMDPGLQVRALDLVNGLNKGELNELFSKLGEEKFAYAITDALVSARKVGDKVEGIGFSTTRELADLVVDVYRRHGIRKWRVHPATRVFQALRIAVNDELNALREALPQALEVTKHNGCILVISFHSLEDRIIKNTFRDWQDQGLGQVLTKKPVLPGVGEVRRNPRSRSAKMRVFKRYDYH